MIDDYNCTGHSNKPGSHLRSCINSAHTNECYANWSCMSILGTKMLCGSQKYPSGQIRRFSDSADKRDSGSGSGETEPGDSYYDHYRQVVSGIPFPGGLAPPGMGAPPSSPGAVDDYETPAVFAPNPSSRLSHVDSQGRANMVDVGGKPVTQRAAVAEATVILGPTAFALVAENKIKKGDVLTVAELAGIMAAKSTSTLIPLCHPLPLTKVTVTLSLESERQAIGVNCECRCEGRTGLEMEALTGASLAALTVYDMCKAVSRDIVITDVKLVSKSGGASGDYSRQ